MRNMACRVTERIHFSFLREQRRNHSRRGDGGHVVEVGLKLFLTEKKVDRRVFAGDIDQVVWLANLRAGDYSASRPNQSPLLGSLIPSPVSQKK